MLTHGSHVKVTQNRARETKDSTHGISDPSDRPADEVRAHPSYGSEIRVSGSLSDLPGVYPTPGLRRRSVAELEPSIRPAVFSGGASAGPWARRSRSLLCPGRVARANFSAPVGLRLRDTTLFLTTDSWMALSGAGTYPGKCHSPLGLPRLI